MKIIVDCHGSDLGAKVAVEGSIRAVNNDESLNIILCGVEEEIKHILSNFDYNENQIEILPATEIIYNTESPTEAVRKKKDSSLVRAYERLKEDKSVVGLVSCGSTGAVLTGAILKLGRIKDISRPALCPMLPTANGGKVLLIDSGANIDCKPINLVHFAIMATSYAKAYLNVENPRVALLNIGVEDKKGNQFSHECFELLKSAPINFVGNMEARDFLSGNYDIVVADGFDGNILLKSVEGTASMVLGEIKKGINDSFMSKIGAMFMKHTFKNLKDTFNTSNHGGAAFLGVKKLVVKGHGASDALAFEKCILQVKTLAEFNLCKKIETQVASLGGLNDGEWC